MFSKFPSFFAEHAFPPTAPKGLRAAGFLRFLPTKKVYPNDMKNVYPNDAKKVYPNDTKNVYTNDTKRVNPNDT